MNACREFVFGLLVWAVITGNRFAERAPTLALVFVFLAPPALAMLPFLLAGQTAYLFAVLLGFMAWATYVAWKIRW